MKQPKDDFRRKTCPVCGKVFECYTDTWCYYRSPYGTPKKYLCSWKCLNEFDRIRRSHWKRRGRARQKGESQ